LFGEKDIELLQVEDNKDLCNLNRLLWDPMTLKINCQLTGH